MTREEIASEQMAALIQVRCESGASSYDFAMLAAEAVDAADALCQELEKRKQQEVLAL